MSTTKLPSFSAGFSNEMAFDDSYNDTLEVDEPVNLDIEVTESSEGKRRFAGAGDTAKNVAKTLGLGLLNSINPFATILGYVVIVKVVADEIKWHRNKAFREKQQKKGLDNVVKRTQNQVTRTAKWTRELKGEHGEELAPEEDEYIEVAAPESPLRQQ
eukprot:TRINITY_DN3_c0_g1_i2.p1 TRINITY_DN3_c0_g1~~TRINITY_DN3_c0_g1_i2.p1  ORF type:complete len:158 (+),score=39.01 TRINITY_DN3_c0_g1_i2:339-812(+)